MSLNPEQVELLFDTYDQLLELSGILSAEEGEVTNLIKALSNSNPRTFHLLRALLTLLRFPIDPEHQFTARELTPVAGVSTKTVQRDLDFLVESQYLTERRNAKGKWSHPGSRLGDRGRPPYRYVLNPMVMDYYFFNSSVDNELRRSLYLIEKILLTNRKVRDISIQALATMCEKSTRIMAQFPMVLEALDRIIPETAERLRKIGIKEPPSNLIERLSCLIWEEIFAKAVLEYHILLQEEMLPEQEHWRLQTLAFN